MRRAIALVALSLLLVSCTEKPSPNLGTSTDVKKAFVETLSDRGLRRWEKTEVTYTWAKGATAQDRLVLAELVSWLNTIESMPDVREATPDVEADVVLRSINRSEWGSYDKTPGSYDGASGVTIAEWDGRGRMTRAEVLVDATNAQSQRNRTIVHEFMHALGVGHHSCPSGLVYGAGDFDPEWRTTEFDRQILVLTYYQGFRTGQTASDLAMRIEETSKEPKCGSPAFETVEAEENLLWCLRGEGVRPCQTANDQVPPNVAGTPSAWVKEDVVYSYDPSLYIAFQTDEGRVLCKKPNNGRGDCQVTEGSFVATPTLWTDGETLYR